MGYLFDLDGTILDTSAIASLRNARRWKECVAQLRSTSLFPEVLDVLRSIDKQGGKIAVVTTSVSFYASAALRHHKVPHNTLVAYHDVSRRKPYPDAYLKALEQLGLAKHNAIGIGDDAVDADALRAAGISSAGAAWNPNYHADASWDYVAGQPSSIVDF